VSHKPFNVKLAEHELRARAVKADESLVFVHFALRVLWLDRIAALIRDAFEPRAHDPHVLALSAALAWLSLRRPLPSTYEKRHALEWIRLSDEGSGREGHEQGKREQTGGPTHQHVIPDFLPDTQA